MVAIPAVLLYGIAKGGFAGSLGVAAVPLMALAVSPVQAAAILLPILCVMDLVALWKYRGRWVLSELKLLIPASMAGIAVGTILFGYLNAAIVRLLLGSIAIFFTLHFWLTNRQERDTAQTLFGPKVGIAAAATSGFTSFVAHAGGPPLSMYLLGRGLDRTAFVGTTVVFFTFANYVKLVPYTWLGQFDSSNLMTSLVLSPLAPIGIIIGVSLHNRVTDQFFFKVAYAALFSVGIKLMWDGISNW